MRLVCLVATVATLGLAAPTSAQDQIDATGFFAGVDAGGVFRSGGSRTTDGGESRNGVVSGVRFSEAFAIGGHLGYRLNSQWSAFVSYDHVSGDVTWQTDFPFVPRAHFKTNATSNIFLGNLDYSHALADSTNFTIGAGAGISVNSLSNADEKSLVFGHYATLDGQTTVSPAVRALVGIEQQIAPQVAIGLNASISYLGGFETGSAREYVGLGRQVINPYRLSNVWGAAVTASLKARF